jgi:hypothetical protein
MGDASFSKGGVQTRNLRAGAVTLSGGADTSFAFNRSMKSEPEVVATAQSDANVFVVSKDQNGFTLGTGASSDVDVGFIAFNDDRR